MEYVNPEFLLIPWLANELGLPVVADVPADRPQRFVTVERTGGATGLFLDSPQIAVQAWAETRAEAAKLSERIKSVLPALRMHPQVGRVTVNASYNFPGEGGEPRYQIVLDLVTHNI